VLSRRAALAALAMLGTAGGLAVSACEQREPRHELRGRTMGTSWRVLAVAPTIERSVLESEVETVLEQVDLALSTYRPDSELSRFNAQRSDGWVAVSTTVLELALISAQLSTETDGAFDPTVAPLLQLWGIGAARGPLASAPDEAALADARARVGHELLDLRRTPPALRKRLAGLELNVDAVAPGYAVDLIAARFEALGVTRYLVEIGGEVRGRGHSERGQPWRVAIERPQVGRPVPYAVVELDGMAISTSGDYRSGHEVGGERVSHTLDPRSLRPVRHRLAAVSVIAPTAARADALATALTVMGPVAGLAWAEERDIPALFLLPGADGHLEERATRAFGRIRRL
jgi:thiamine biosynthesis lipoprotein